MTWLVENPWPALVAGIGIEAVLAVALFRTGRVMWLVAMGAVAALVALLLLVERFVITDREKVEGALDRAVVALEANDREAVLATISPRSSELRSFANIALNEVKIIDAHIGNDLVIEINRYTSPPTATARFTGRVNIRDRRGTMPYENAVQPVELELERDQGRWLISSYKVRRFGTKR